MNNLQNNEYNGQFNAPPLLEVDHLSLSFRQLKKGLRETTVDAIHDFHLTVEDGEVVAVVGASGAGKSLLADAILGILPDSADVGGAIYFNGEKLTDDSQLELRGKQIALIPQSLKALDPLMKVGKQVQAAIPKEKQDDKNEIQRQIFQKLNLPAGTGDKLPFELSGGMARRVLIATAMASEAKLVIADEPTPGLDEQTRDQAVRYIEQLAADGRGVMFITHDIQTALQIADKVAVFYEGKTIEIADVDDFTGEGEKLEHPYTKALWNALPQNGFQHLKEVNVNAEPAVIGNNVQEQTEETGT